MNGYNLLISGDSQAWERNFFHFPKERLFEGTQDCHIQKFKGTNDDIPNKLMAYPALFLQERFRGESKIGYITEIKSDGRFYLLTLDYKYILDSNKLSEAEYDLGIGGATSRTYWAFKDVDISNVIRAHQLLSDYELSILKIAVPISERCFDVAFSFPGEKREYVKNIVTQLKKIYSEIFYDEYFTEDLAVPGMDLVLTNVYKMQSKLVCVFLCNEYEKKRWCNLEWRVIREIIDEHKNKSLMLFRFDDTEIPGISSNDGYIDVNKYNETDIVNFITSRIQKMKIET
jgi:hypothetical protein